MVLRAGYTAYKGQVLLSIEANELRKIERRLKYCKRPDTAPQAIRDLKAYARACPEAAEVVEQILHENEIRVKTARF